MFAGRPLGWVPAISPGAWADYPFSRAPPLLRYRSHLVEDGADPIFVRHQAGHSWAPTTAIYTTTVGADHTNRALRAVLDRAFGDQGDR